MTVMFTRPQMAYLNSDADELEISVGDFVRRIVDEHRNREAREAHHIHPHYEWFFELERILIAASLYHINPPRNLVVKPKTLLKWLKKTPPVSREWECGAAQIIPRLEALIATSSNKSAFGKVQYNEI